MQDPGPKLASMEAPIRATLQSLRAGCTGADEPSGWVLLEARHLGPLERGETATPWPALLKDTGRTDLGNAVNDLAAAQRLVAREIMTVMERSASDPLTTTIELRDLVEEPLPAGAGGIAGSLLAWALADAEDPPMAWADWMAFEIDQDRPSAVALVTKRDVPIETLGNAKLAFKAMRLHGDTVPDRRLAARFYLAAIASAIVHYDQRISRQSDAAVQRNLADMRVDTTIPEALQELAGMLLHGMKSG